MGAITRTCTVNHPIVSLNFGEPSWAIAHANPIHLTVFRIKKLSFGFFL